jgi:hypothetical protein
MQIITLGLEVGFGSTFQLLLIVFLILIPFQTYIPHSDETVVEDDQTYRERRDRQTCLKPGKIQGNCLKIPKEWNANNQ